jgi:hypothetical protein
MTLLPASEKFLSKFPSSRYLSSSGSYPLDLSGMGDPAGSNATADLALRITGTHKPFHRDKVEYHRGEEYRISENKNNLEDKLQAYNKINGAMRRHFGKK